MHSDQQTEPVAFERVNYFDGQVLTAQDFEDEQGYYREKRRLHNRLLHGWGVVCGLGVSLQGEEIRIEPGLALDCQGNEIVVRDQVTARLPEAGRDRYVVVEYVERLSKYVPAPGASEPQPSRVTEGYRIGLEDADPCIEHPTACLERGCSTPHPVPLARLAWRQARWSARGHACARRPWWWRMLASLLGLPSGQQLAR